MLDQVIADSNLTTEKLTPLGQQLRAQKFLRFNNALPFDTCQILSTRVQTLLASGSLKKCEQCLSSHWAYDDPLYVEVHQLLRTILSERLGINLLTSFSSVRYYPHGETLSKHLDRDAAELVLSLTIDYEGNSIWPLNLQLEAENSPVNEIILARGDAVLFSGSQLYHWREPLENQWQIQAFFFFVDADGPFKDHAGDMINKYKDRS
jgi:hypothetical protein